MRQAGSMYIESYGANRPAINGLGRWTDQKHECSAVMVRSYLKNLPPEALYAAAGFAVQPGQVYDYFLPRGRSHDVTDVNNLIKDADMVCVMNHLFPNCIDNAKRAESSTSFYSVSNRGFTKFIISAVASWIQDSCLMMKRYPALKSIEPYTYLYENRAITKAYERIARKVIQHIQAPPVDVKGNLERHHVIKHMDYCAGLTRDHIDDLPRAFAKEMRSAFVELKDNAIEWLRGNIVPNMIIQRKDESSEDNLREQHLATADNYVPDITSKDDDNHDSIVPKQNATFPDSSDEQYTFKKFTSTKLPVWEWVEEIQSLKGKKLIFYQRQEKEKRSLVFEMVQSTATEKSLSIESVAKNLGGLIGRCGGTMGDVEALCRCKRKKKEDGITYDILEEKNIQLTIAERKEKEKLKREKRKRGDGVEG